MLALAAGAPALAKDKPGSGRSAGEEKGAVKLVDKATPTSSAAKEPWIGVRVVISPSEREVIRNYVTERTTPAKPGKKAKGLPPGLAKKLERGGQLPPGWEKKCVVGQIMPPEVYRECEPLPRAVISRLPPPPPGTILVAIDGKVARLIKATHEILDIFDVPLPLP